jgi:hypothetical protein
MKAVLAILCLVPFAAGAQEYTDPVPWEQQAHPPSDPGKLSLKPGSEEIQPRTPYWVSLTTGLVLAAGGLVLTVPNLTLNPPGPKPGFNIPKPAFNLPMTLAGIGLLTAAAPISLFLSGGSGGVMIVAVLLELGAIGAAWGMSRVSWNVFNHMIGSSSEFDKTIGQTIEYPVLFLAVPLCLAAAFAPVVASFVTGADIENEGNEKYLRETDTAPEIGLFTTQHGGVGLMLTVMR